MIFALWRCHVLNIIHILYSDIINLFFPFEKMRNTETRLRIEVELKKNKSHRRVSLRAKNTKNANKHCQAMKDSVLQKKSTVGATGA